MGPRAQASNALGWVSIGCWVLVYSPQIIENYQLQSGEGLSVLFVLIWLFGDLTNLVGAGIAGLLPTVIIIAVYYTLCDIILIVQIYWYRHCRQRHSHANDAERAPLLLQPTPPKKSDEPNRNSSTSTWVARTLEYVGGLCFVTSFGLAAWWLSSRGETSGEGEPATRPEIVVDLTSQVLGWLSAISYLGARIPQILKNRQTKCNGLSLALFMFAILGNITYVLSICVSSIERTHLIANAPWLAGSGLTVFLDFVVLGQFFYYRSEEPQSLEDPSSVDQPLLH